MATERLTNEEFDQPTHEVEMRCDLTSPQYDILRTVLHEQATFLREEDITDVYYCPNDTQSFDEIEMDKVGSYSLRLRRSKVKSQEKVELNMKVITEEGDHNNWEEHEVEVSSFAEAQIMLGRIGLKPYFTLEKHRTSFASGDMTVALEDIKDYGSVMEVEILTERTKTAKAKDSIRGFMKEHGIQGNQIVAKSITNRLMRQRATF